jgi:D-3-phosphoglycerate dehydrogenase
VKKRKILFIDTAHPVLTSELEKDGWECHDYPGKNRDEIRQLIPGYTGVIIRSKVKLDRDLLSAAVNLKFIGRVGAGLENIEVEYATSRGIVCLNAPEGNRDAVGEQAIGMLLMLFNNLKRADSEVRKGIWKREANRGIELGGKTIGIIGYGNTGGAFARKLKGFGVEVLAYDKYKFGFSDAFVKESGMQELFEQCDIVSLHVPLTAETTCLADHDFFESFKKDIFVINTSRGKVLDTQALIDSVGRGKVRGACLDVLEYEGLSFENLDSDHLPEAFRELVSLENVILSPHIAGWTGESAFKLAMVIAEKIRSLKLF